MSFRYNPLTGNFDIAQDSGGSSASDVTATAFGVISALKVVYAISATQVAIADQLQPHKPIGVALNAAGDGDSITFRTFGEVEDASFLFAVNEPLFFNSVGSITNIPPSTGYHTEIGHGMGVGKIFVSIKNQITL